MSKIEVNAIEPQCGTTLTVGAAGTTVTVPSNVVKSNALQASDAGNIISQSGTTITLGASGDSINLASGASQTGFGRTGTVDWDTTPKTATFSAVSGNGYFVNTTAGAITVNLPAGVAGDIVSVSDYAGTATTNNISISANGSEKIESGTSDASIYENRDAITLVYVDAVQGWVPVNNNEKSSVLPPAFIVASSPCVSTVGDFKIHKFTGPGTFTVCSAGNAAGSNTVDHMVVAGGGGGGRDRAGGGGGGGFRLASGLPVTAQGYAIAIGAGGLGASPGANGNNGSVSTFSTITSAGGGGGGKSNSVGNAGGSGGGGGSANPCNSGSAGGAGNTPSVSPSQGNNGGTGANPSSPITTDTRSGGGGGGGSAVGGNAVTGNEPGSGVGGPGGAGGDASPIFGSNPQTFYGPTNGIYSGGGGGGGRISGAPPAPGGTGGGGRGATPGVSAGAGSINSGGGGGGADGSGGAGEDGGSGVILIRYKFQ